MQTMIKSVGKGKRTSKKKHSLRRKITTFMFLNSCISNLILSVLVILIIVTSVTSLGMGISNIIASDVVGELENPMSLGKFGNTSIESIDTNSEHFQKWLNAIGNKFYFNMSSGFVIHTEEELMDMEMIPNGGFENPNQEGLAEFEFVFLEIDLNDTKVFSTLPKNMNIEDPVNNPLGSHFFYVSKKDFRNTSGENIGTVKVMFNPYILVGITFILICIFIFATLLSNIVSFFMSKIMAKSLTNPLHELQVKLNNLADGDIESAFNSEVIFKKPMVEIENLASATNMIIEKMKDYTEKLEDHRIELTAQNEELEEKGTHLILINNQLEAMNIQMKDILDNVGQGFLRFDENLIIHSGYSQECMGIFKNNISNQFFSKLIFPDDPEQADFVDELLLKILRGDPTETKLYLPLLPDEVQLNEHIIKIDYRLSKQMTHKKSMVVILTDITEKRKLEAQMDKEQHILKMVVKALVNRSMFVEVAENFEQFMTEGIENKWQFTQNQDENLQYIMRQLHTFKGNFSQFDVVQLSEALHTAENQLLGIIQNEGVCNFGDCLDANALITAYHHDVDIIKNYVGEDYMLQEDYFLIERSRIVEIEHKMQSLLSEQDCRILLPEIRSLCYKPIKELFKMYPEYTLKLAERLDKTIHNFEIESENILVDEIRFQDFIKSMVHVFRNAVDHGIELPDDRVDSGKDMMGTIKCAIKQRDESLEIVIEDDGKGIDLELIKEKLLSSGVDQDQIDAMSEPVLLSKIFDDNFSTKKEVSLFSGRGVGLSAVKKEVEALEGTIQINSKFGIGTTFVFTLPLQEKTDVHTIMPMNLMEALASTSADYLRNQVEDHTITTFTEIMSSKKIELKQLTALVSLKGVINALIMISVNQPLARKLAQSFLIKIKEDEDIEPYIEDVLAEIANTVLGNTLGRLDDTSEFLHMGIPAIISNKGAYVKYTEAEILTSNLHYEQYEWSVHMIQLENNHIEEESLWQE
ncbi:ATP-binding protein [Fusibacter ferrireducens]|uniref:histidine kinase n=1 Tax=Fusibacter ferrireducens TaxID=2785058 RepID=A0ABR9ZNP0_9FIRM|nr:ATP-binding protein [Fusibacter ferrireducens]MBF4692054.1 chemotaxis protein CheX [Fusibacter ferrireducens]